MESIDWVGVAAVVTAIAALVAAWRKDPVVDDEGGADLRMAQAQKVSAEATEIIQETALELIRPLKEQIGELGAKIAALEAESIERSKENANLLQQVTELTKENVRLQGLIEEQNLALLERDAAIDELGLAVHQLIAQIEAAGLTPVAKPKRGKNAKSAH
jgi:TolA-binding protein